MGGRGLAGAVHNLVATKDMLVVLGAAAIVVPFVRRFNVSPVLGFLAAGVALGPNGLGALGPLLPAIDWVTIRERETIAAIAEYGVVFLLFVIGLELTLARLTSMRRLVFGLGGLQVLLSALAIGLVASRFLDLPAALTVGAALALSSTAIVIEVLAGEKRVASATGRATFAILICQDLAVVPILFIVGSHPEGSVLQGLAFGLIKAAVTIGLIVVVGKFLLAPLFRMVAGRDSREFFMAATLLVAIGTGMVAASAGLSMALGAFIAGLLIAETEYRRAVEATIEPFKSLLLGVFFFAVGMSLDLATVLQHPGLVVAALTCLLLVKGLLVFVLARVFRLSRPVAIEAAFLLAPAGEFAFVVFQIAADESILAPDQAALAVAVASLSMALTPLLGIAGHRLGKRFERPVPVDPEVQAPLPADGARRAIVVGYGRVGHLVADMLGRHGVSYLAVDADARGVAHWRRESKSVYWGDATDAAFLERCGLMEASALVVTIDKAKEVEAIVATARALRPELVIVARARDADHARSLYAMGVTDAVPETIEASLQLSEAALVGLGVATGPVIASIHERRDEFRQELQGAAGRPTHAVKPKRLRSS